MFTLESFKMQYDVITTEAVVKNRNFRFFLPQSLDRFIDPEDIFHDFPLWTKVWEASLILADYLAGLPAEAEKRFLEIGCGLGVVGIVASSFGHKVTMTEYDQNALGFARANALLNPPPEGANLEIRALDWNSPRIQRTFDYIIGSEVTYKENDFQPILNLFRSCLKENGEIILSGCTRKTTMAFMSQMGELFQITAQKKILRSRHEEIMVLLCRMRLKESLRSSPSTFP